MRVSGFGVETSQGNMTTLSYILTIALYYCQQSSIFPSIELNVLLDCCNHGSQKARDLRCQTYIQSQVILPECKTL